MPCTNVLTVRWNFRLTGALVGALLVPGVAFAGQARLNVCHREGSGAFNLIKIGEPAYATHLQHGDRAIGDGVPGMGPAWVFDSKCRPSERPLTLLARVWSTDQSGTQHDLARLEDTNYDGLPSAGDTLRLGQFPYFNTDGSVAYGGFTVTTHAVTGTYVLKAPDHVALALYSEGRFWAIVQYDPTADLGWYDEAYTERDTTGDTSFFIDSTPPGGVDQWDYTLVMSGSPGHPAPNAGWASGPASTNLIDIEFLWAY